MTSSPIYHITKAEQAKQASSIGEYTPEAFEEDGFIHCSYPHQLPAVANDNFSGQNDLVLLEIDRSKIPCRVIDENLEGGEELYPHIYGPLPMPAVNKIIELPCRADGTFEFPKGS